MASNPTASAGKEPRRPPATSTSGSASPTGRLSPPQSEGKPDAADRAEASEPGPSSAVSLPGTAAAAAAGIPAAPPPPPAQPLPPELQPLQEYGRLLNRLAQSLLASMLDQPPRAQWNVLLSPISLASTLAALVAGSDDATQEDLCRLLNLQLPELEAIIERFKTESADHMFYVANRMFLRQDCGVLPTFRAHIETKYMTTAQNVDFESSDQPYARTINEWCSNATNGKLPAVVSRKTFAPNTSMVIVSAVFFRGLWKEKFSPNATHMMQFHVTRADTLDVRMMMRTGRFPYADMPSLRVRALEVPYRTGKLAMVLILPTEVDGLRLTQQSLLYGDTLWDLVRGLRPRANVRLGLPKFVLTARNKLRDMLHELGSNRPFEHDQAQFMKISGNGGLHTTELLQAVTVEVSEDGNEIARTSALVTEVVSKVAPATVFLVDRPFLFLVRSTTTGAILLCGCVRQPLEWRPESPDNSALL